MRYASRYGSHMMGRIYSSAHLTGGPTHTPAYYIPIHPKFNIMHHLPLDILQDNIKLGI